MTELTTTERHEFAQAEAVIARGLKTFVEVGEALMTIRKKRLYRASHRTFEEYCQERWGMTRMRASQLIQAADTVQNVNNCLQSESALPATESQARPLAKLPPEQQGAAWQRAVETAPAGKVTAAHVERVVEELVALLPPEEPPAALTFRGLRDHELAEEPSVSPLSITDFPPELVQAVVLRMQRDKKKAKRVAERRRAIEDASARNAVLPVGERIYRVIYADPPWSYQNTPSPDVVTPDCHYPLMTIDDIAAMPISRMVMDDAVLFLWVPSPLLVEGLRVCQDWGFVYKAMFVWDKVKHNMGHYNSVRHELLFVCTRGSCMPDRPQLLDSVVSIERTEHSRKPDEFRAIIDALYPDGPRIELFARTVPTGWDVFGNEV